mgnify:CR=1 FL=1
MGTKYSQLNEQDRVFLAIMIEKDYSKPKIAAILKTHRSTIYREIKRNSTNYRYKKPKITYYAAFLAQKKSLARKQRSLKLNKNTELRCYVHEKLAKGWSPWQIEGRLKLENPGKCLISHETIYRYIYSEYSIRNRFFNKLRRKHFLRRKHNSRKERFPKDLLIHNRPDIINNREEFGHWECDLMIFKQGVKSNLITLRERNTRYVIAIKNLNKTASGTALAIISSMKKLKPHIKSITFDQGSEFMKYQWLKDCLDADIYFCDPASPHQKGSIENVNGVLRVEFPRNINLELIKQKEISKISKKINERPLKCLSYKTPEEVFNCIYNTAKKVDFKN